MKWTIKTSDISKWTIEPNRKIIKTHVTNLGKVHEKE
jgi:streptomycin 6-kinase